MKAFPFLSQAQAIVLLRISLAVVFLAHAIVRITNGSIPQFAGFLENKGLPFGMVLVWMITLVEITGGVLLVIGRYIKWASLSFLVILVVGIVLIHASLGWFVGEHGSGGMEYSFILIIAFLVITAHK